MAYWSNYTKLPNNNAEKIFYKISKENAEFKLKNKMYKEAVYIYEKLLKATNNYNKILAKYLIACSQFDPKLADQIASKFPAIDIKSLNIDSLENAPSINKTTKELKDKDDTDKDKKVIKPKKKKKKKIRYPKNFDPNAKNPPPDPERWIAKKDRAYNKRKKQKLARGGGQGAAPTVETKITSPTVKLEPKAVSAPPKGKLAPKGKGATPPVAVETSPPKGKEPAKPTPKEVNSKPAAKTEPVSPKQTTASPKNKESAGKPIPKEVNPKPITTEQVSPKQSQKGTTPVPKGKEPPQDLNEKKEISTPTTITSPTPAKPKEANPAPSSKGGKKKNKKK